MAYIIDKYTKNKVTSHHNFYAVMDFYPESELHLSDDEQSFVNTANYYFTNGVKALEAYINSPREYSQLATGDTLQELKECMANIINNINTIINSYGIPSN